jgi:hypothetical protein
MWAVLLYFFYHLFGAISPKFVIFKRKQTILGIETSFLVENVSSLETTLEHMLRL